MLAASARQASSQRLLGAKPPGPSRGHAPGPPLARTVHTVRPPGRSRPVEAPTVLAPVACDHRRAPLPLSWVLAFGVVVCLAVVALGMLANAGSGASTVPQRTAVVRVEQGESLLQLAERVAPGSDPSAVVDRIRELNRLDGSGVRPGQPLTVPSEG